MEETVKNQVEENQRFTTMISTKLLSNIKLISYFTNKKLYETINDSIQLYIQHFEQQNNTTLDSIINLQSKFSLPKIDKVDDKKSSPLNPKEDK